jgi:hypothetical protein
VRTSESWKRKKEKPEEKTEIREIDAPPSSKELKKRWSYFIQKVYETDPAYLSLMPRRNEHRQLH